MRQAADEAGLELNMELPGTASQTIGQSTAASTEQVTIQERCRRFRNETYRKTYCKDYEL